MIFRSDDRAQSLQVGAVLLFGFLVLGLTIFQAQGVPEEIKQSEFDHSQAVSDEMIEFYLAVFETVNEGEPRTASITLGTHYDERLFFIYPPPASGTLQTTEGEQLQLHNVTAIEDPGLNNSFSSYWNNETRNYTTQAISYSPNYRELRGTADHWIEYGVLAAQYPETTQLQIADRHRPVIDGTNISIVMFNGTLQDVGVDTETAIPERVTDSTAIRVTNVSNSSPITLDLPTELPEENWNTTNPDSALHNQSNVENVTVEDGTAEIQLNATKDYTLRLHKVDIGAAATAPRPTYIRNVSYDGTTATFQLRDEFNDLAADTTEVSVYNTTGGVYNITRNISVTDGERAFDPEDPADACGVSLLTNVSNTTSYERLNITDNC